MVGDIVGEAQGDGTVKFTWGEPETNWSGSYLYRVKLPDEETELDSTRTNEVTVNAQPARTCLEVTAVRADGKASPAKTACSLRSPPQGDHARDIVEVSAVET